MGSIVQTAEFNQGLERLSTEDRYRVYDALGKVLRDSRAPGLQIKKMQRVDLWEIRASQELRIIAKLDGGDVFCLTVGHHDATLARAERMRPPSDDERKLIAGKVSALLPAATETNPQQVVRRGPLSHLEDKDLEASFGIPKEWLPTIRALSKQDQVLGCGIDEILTEDNLWKLIEIFEAPSAISTGANPVYRVSSEAIAKAFAKGEIEQLEFNLPASSWAIVHSGRLTPQLVKGGPGSGKTLIALYRALNIIESPSLLGRPRVLYVTYTKQLRDDAIEKVRRLRGRTPPGIEIQTFDQMVSRFSASVLKTTFEEKDVRLAATSAVKETSIDPNFLIEEIEAVIQWRNVKTYEEYSKLSRRGRGSRLSVADRERVWACYERFTTFLSARKLQTLGAARMLAATNAVGLREEDRYDFIIVDEVQDLPTSVLAMVVALAKGDGTAKHLMLVGDAGQAIYQHGFKWSDVGLRLAGANVHTLGKSERSTQEILEFAAAIIGNAAIGDEKPLPVTSSKRGIKPRILSGFRSTDHRREFIASEIAKLVRGGIDAGQVAVIAHGKKELSAIEADLKELGIKSAMYQTPGFYRDRAVKLITAHSSKGLEFSQVYIPDANDGTYPFFSNTSLEDEEREDLDAQDCALFYVACTRAADVLTIAYDRDPSPFLHDATSHAILVDISGS